MYTHLHHLLMHTHTRKSYFVTTIYHTTWPLQQQKSKGPKTATSKGKEWLGDSVSVLPTEIGIKDCLCWPGHHRLPLGDTMNISSSPNCWLLSEAGRVEHSLTVCPKIHLCPTELPCMLGSVDGTLLCPEASWHIASCQQSKWWVIQQIQLKFILFLIFKIFQSSTM